MSTAGHSCHPHRRLLLVLQLGLGYEIVEGTMFDERQHLLCIFDDFFSSITPPPPSGRVPRSVDSYWFPWWAVGTKKGCRSSIIESCRTRTVLVARQQQQDHDTTNNKNDDMVVDDDAAPVEQDDPSRRIPSRLRHTITGERLGIVSFDSSTR